MARLGRSRAARAVPPEHEAVPEEPAGNLVIDRTWQSSKLDELENALNTLVSPQHLVPLSREGRAGGLFGFRGQFDLGIFRVHVDQDVETKQIPEEADDRMAFVTTQGGASQLTIGRETFTFSPHRAVIFSSGPERRIVIPKDAGNHVLIMSRRKIAECCAKLLGHDIPGFVDFDVDADLETAAGQSFQRLLAYAEAEMSDPHALIRLVPAAWRQFEQSLLTGFLLSQRHAYSEALLKPQSPAVPFYVKRAEAFIEAHFSEPLSLADIAAAAGIGARSLQNGFQSFRSMTPMAFLRMVRLRHVRQALLQADPALTTVTSVALACGFGHMGEFTTLYSRTYGESPGQTLARSRRS